MTDDRIYGLGAKQSPPDERDFPIAAAYAMLEIEEPTALPSAFRAPAPYPPVLDQDGTPQCVAYSASWIKAYQDLRDQGAFDFDEDTFFHRIGGTADGAYGRDAFKEMLADGYPVRLVDKADQHKIGAYYSVPVLRDQICAAIYTFGPLMLLTPWANSWFRPINGVLPPFDTSGGGHAVALDGWDQRGVLGTNSWGPGWGEGGRFCLPWDQLWHAWEAWKSLDVIEPKPTPPPPHPLTYSIRVAASAHVKVALLGPHGCIRGWTTRVWGPRTSTASSMRPIIKKGCSSGQATVAYALSGVFKGKYVRIGSGVSIIVHR